MRQVKALHPFEGINTKLYYTREEREYMTEKEEGGEIGSSLQENDILPDIL
jgi:hypothetical protein